MKKILFLLSIILLIQTCKKDNGIGSEEGVYQVDPTFEPYVQEFIAEGAKRGKTVDFSDSGLIVEFSDMIVQGASGFCYVGQHHVVIDKSEWTSLSEDVRGFLLFHELGHCELDRGHRNDKFNNNSWRSIMRGSPLAGIEVWIPVPYFGFRREYFIDELFNEQIAAPSWANQDFDFNEVAENRKELIKSEENVNRINQRFTNVNGDYEIEIDFNLIKNRPNRSKLSWGTSNYNYFIEFFPEVGFNVSGYFIEVHKDSKDNSLFYSLNTININGEELHKITIRREGGLEKIFMNDQFIYHIDPLPNPLEMIKMEETKNDGSIDNAFEINSFEVKKIN